MLDIRIPIGLLFAIMGVILLIFGFVSNKQIYDTHSLGMNINVIWGGVMLVFGAAMLALVRWKRQG
jgi:hypothetical protein